MLIRNKWDCSKKGSQLVTEKTELGNGWRPTKLETELGLRPYFFLNGNNRSDFLGIIFEMKCELFRQQRVARGYKMTRKTIAGTLFILTGFGDFQFGFFE